MSKDINREPTNHLLVWEKIEQDISNGKHTYRANVPGGWFVRFVSSSCHPTDVDHIFLPDKNHTWGTVEPKE